MNTVNARTKALETQPINNLWIKEQFKALIFTNNENILSQTILKNIIHNNYKHKAYYSG